MAADLVTTPTPVETPAPPAPVEDVSIADHAAQFDPAVQREEPPAAEPARGKRSAKQAATPEDVPRIKELTAKWRSEERRAQELEAKLKAYETRPPTVTPEAAPAVVKPPTATEAKTFEKPEPKLEQFMDKDDPYAAWNRACAKWDRERDTWEADQQRSQQTSQQAEHAQHQEQQQQIQRFTDKLQTFKVDHPDYAEKVSAVVEQPPELLLTAILADDNGPALVYHLATHSADRLQMHLLTDGKTVSPALVAQTQRLLSHLLGTASTGAVPQKTPFVTAPTPTTPVRGGSLMTDAKFPGEVGSIADHARTYGPARR